LRTAERVDYFIANSQFVRERIKRIYGRDAHIIYPPVDVNRFSLNEKKENFYLVVSRLEPYKKVNLIVEAFTKMPDKRLVVIGDGSQMKKIKEIAGRNIEILGYQKDEVVKEYMEKAKAFIYAAEEDFGIVMVEAQSAGTPVLAYRKGGASEIVLEGVTGLFFDSQTPDAIIEAIKKLERSYDKFDFKEIRKNSLRFSIERFRKEFKEFVDKVLGSK
jgi:glycosyltransferase involved in cell wall biosynthesis